MIGASGALAALASWIGLSRLDAFEIGVRVVANADAVGDRPIKAGREQDVGAGEPVAHQELPAVCERDLDMAQLLAKILAGLGDDLGRDAVDRTERVGAMAAHHVKAGGIQFRDDEEAPLQPGGIVARGFRDQRALRRRIHARQVGDDRGALADAEVAVLQQRNLLARIEPGVFRGLGLARPRSDRLRLVGQAEFVHRPVRPNRAAGADAPQRQIRCRAHLTISPRRGGDRAHGSSRPALLMREPVGFGDRRGLGQAVRRDFACLDALGRLHALMDRLAVDAGVDQEMHDVNVLRSQFARHRLGHRAKSELRRRKCRKPLAAAHAGGRAGKEDGAASARKHDARRLAADQEAGVAGEFPRLEEQLFGGFEQRLVDVRSGVEQADLDRPELSFDLGEHASGPRLPDGHRR